MGVADGDPVAEAVTPVVALAALVESEGRSKSPKAEAMRVTSPRTSAPAMIRLRMMRGGVRWRDRGAAVRWRLTAWGVLVSREEGWSG